MNKSLTRKSYKVKKLSYLRFKNLISNVIFPFYSLDDHLIIGFNNFIFLRSFYFVFKEKETQIF